MSRLLTFARRWSGRGGTIAFVVAALALARVIGDQYPDAAAHYARPHLVQVALGETAHLRTMDVVVDAPQVGTTVQDDWSVLETSGVFVQVEVAYTPTLEDTGLRYAEIVDAQGRSFTTTRSGSNTCTLSRPLVTSHCSVALELPADAVPGATLRLAADGFNPGYDSMLEVPLGLDAADVEAALADPTPLVPVPELMPGLR